MADLIPFATRQVGNDTVNTVDARNLYDFLAPKSRFHDWIMRRIQQYGFSEDRNFTVLKTELGPISHQAEYFLTLGMAKELSMVERTKKGKEARQYFLACEEQLKTHQAGPAVLNPEHQLMIDMIVQLDRTEQRAKAAEATAARAEGKADMALADARTMTLEEFVLANGLLRQMPEAHWPSYVTWLKDVCLALGHDFSKGQVLGKRWQMENVYPLQALCALKHHVQTKPTQLALVRPHEHNGHA